MCSPKPRIFLSGTYLIQQLMYRPTSGKNNFISASAVISRALTTADSSLLLSEKHRQRCMVQLRSLPALPRSNATTFNKNEKKTAAVLIAVCLELETNEISLLYTRRSRHLRSHGSQISFPGGKRDESDASFVDCALRETEEEIGLPRERIQIWGDANPIHLPRTSTIVPVVGVVPDFHITQLNLNFDEVEEAFTIPLNMLLGTKAAFHTQFRSGYSSPAFVVHRRRIWGITGYLTYIFLRSLLPITMQPDTLKTNIKFIRPYKLPPRMPDH